MVSRRSRLAALALPVMLAAAACAPAPGYVPAEFDEHKGLGAWADTYDWSPTVVGGTPTFNKATIDTLAQKGVQTLYIQTSRDTLASDIVDESTLVGLIARAKSHGMDVVGWYLPTFVDQAKDLRRMKAMSRLDIDGVGVDIESLKVTDIAARNKALIAETDALNAYYGTGIPIMAITFPPIHLQYVNPSLWPDFPWQYVGQNYDVLVTMSYWTLRKSTSPYRDPTTHVSEDLRLGRSLTGRADLPIHVVGGLGSAATAAEVKAFVAACKSGGCAGGSYYDAGTTSSALWTELKPLATLRDIRAGNQVE